MSDIVCPLYYQIYLREGVKWFAKDPLEVFYNPTNIPTQLKYLERQFGLTAQKIIIELFRINGGKAGYYLVNLREKKYYYCGSEWEDIKNTLQSLGIGRADPVES